MSVLSLVPNLRDLAAKFRLKQFFTCTDKAPYNFVAEKHVQSEHEGWGLSHSACGVHEVSTCEKAMAALVSGHISGMLSLGLSLQHAGVTRELRQVLFDIFAEHLEVRVGVEVCKSHRLAMYDLFLPVGSDHFTTRVHGVHEGAARCKKQSVFANEKRRLILSTFLNGDITQERILHYSPTFRNREDILLDIKKYLIPELLPSGVPLINRNKWLGSEQALSFFGIFLCHHNLLPRIMAAWKKRSPDVTATSASIADGPDLGPNWSSWGSVINGRQASQKPSLPTSDEPEGMQEDDNEDTTFLETLGNIYDPVTGDIDWAEFRKATLGKAQAWCECNPRDIVILITKAFQPVFRLMTDAIWLGSEAFEKIQKAKVMQGELPSFRILELYVGTGMNAFKQSMNNLFHNPLEIWPDSAQVCHMRTLFFRMLSRSMCAVEQIYAIKHRHAPFILFGALWGLTEDLKRCPSCLWDSLTDWFVKAFGVDGLFREEPQCLLAACASISQHDIAGIEVRHAAIRRVLTVKSVNCWGMAFADLSADFFCRQHVILKEGPPKPKRSTPGPSPGKKKNHRRHAGGAWRAFCHYNYQGQFLTDDLVQEASKNYNAIKEAGGSEWDFYANLGLLGTLANKHGHKAYPSFRKPGGPSDPGQTMAVALPSTQVCKLENKLKDMKLQRQGREQMENAKLINQERDEREASARAERELQSTCQLDSLSLLQPSNPSCLCPGELWDHVFFAWPGFATVPARLDFLVPAINLAIAPKLVSATAGCDSDPTDTDNAAIVR